MEPDTQTPKAQSISLIERIQTHIKQLSVRTSRVGTATGAQNRLQAKQGAKRYIPLATLALALFALGTLLLVSLNKKSPTMAVDSRVEVKGAQATMAINHDVEFPIRDAKKKEITKLKFTIESAELRDEIIVKGKRASAIKGRVFLILNTKITNSYEKGLEMNVRDYLRLSRNGNAEELLAPDIHNDPTVIQAISTKYSRIGFPINDTDTNLKLIVGEIDGEKQTIDLVF